MTYLEEVAEKLGMNKAQRRGLKEFIATWAGFSGLSNQEKNSLLNSDALSGESFEEYLERLNDFGQTHLFKKFRGTGERIGMKTAKLPKSLRKKLSEALDKMGIFKANFPKPKDVKFDDNIVVFSASEPKFKQRIQSAFKLADMRAKKPCPYEKSSKKAKTIDAVRQSLFIAAGQRPLWYFVEKNEKIKRPEPLIFEIIARKKSKKLKMKVTAKEIEASALEIFQSLPKEVRGNATLTADAINRHPYFRNCIATEIDLAFALAKKELKVRRARGEQTNYNLVIVDTHCTYDEKGNKKRPTTASTLTALMRELKKVFTKGHFWFVSNARYREEQGLEVTRQFPGLDATTVGECPNKKASTLSDLIEQSVSIAGSFNLLKKIIETARKVTQKKPIAQLVKVIIPEPKAEVKIFSHETLLAA